MKEHRHEHLIKAIVDLIKASPHTIHLYKVKSHIGIVGNEIADEVAGAAARGYFQEEKEDGEHKEMKLPSNNRTEMYWPHTTDESREAGAKKRQGAPPEDRNEQQRTAPTSKPLPNIMEGIQRRCHAMHNLGGANRETIYYKAFQEALPQLDEEATNHFMTSGKITRVER